MIPRIHMTGPKYNFSMRSLATRWKNLAFSNQCALQRLHRFFIAKMRRVNLEMSALPW